MHYLTVLFEYPTKADLDEAERQFKLTMEDTNIALVSSDAADFEEEKSIILV